MKNKEKDILRSGFTLLELMAVMLIMFMLMGMGTVAVNGLLRGSGVSGSVSNIKAVLTQARQFAITKEQPVYVLFDNSKNSMTVCAEYGISDGNYSGFCITEDTLPWGSNTLVGAKVYNLDTGASRNINDHTKVDNGGDRLRTPGISWRQGDAIGFEVADIRYLPSGIEFDSSSEETIIFNPDGTAGEGSGSYTVTFHEMFVENAIEYNLEVSKLTGWVKVK